MTFVLGLLAAVLTWPHVLHLSTTFLGGGSDSLLGARTLWALDAQGGNPFTTDRDLLIGAPDGVAVPASINVANVLFVGTVWVLGQFLGWFAAFNLYNLAGLTLAGTAAFALVDRLKLGFGAASFAAIVFAFNPNHLEKAFGHAPLAMTAILPVLLLALHAKRARPSVVRSLVAGSLLAASFYLNSYLGLFALWMTAIFCVVELVWPPEGRPRYEVLRADYFAATAWVFLMLPTAFSWLSDRESVSALAEDRAEPLIGGGASWQLYLLPSPRHPVFGDAMHDWLRTNLSWEPTMFFGYTTMVLALAGIAIAVVRHRRGDLGRESRAFVWFASMLTLTSFIASLPPKVVIAGLEVPTVAYFLRTMTTLYRVSSRFGVLVGLGLLLLAAYALSQLPRRGRLAAFAPLAAVAVVAGELYVGQPQMTDPERFRVPLTVAQIADYHAGPPVVMNVAHVPSYVRWLARQPRGIVVDYPNSAVPDGRWAWKDLFFQIQHGQPMWQFEEQGSFLASAQEESVDLSVNLTGRILAAVQVRYVVVHTDRFDELDLPRPRLGAFLIPLARFPAEAVAIYKVDAAATRDFAILGKGFHTIAFKETWPEDRKWRWMESRGEILFYADREKDVFLRGGAVSQGRPRALTITGEGGTQVGSLVVQTNETYFRLPLHVKRGRNRFRVVTRPGAEVRASFDPRRVSIAISPLTVIKPVDAAK